MKIGILDTCVGNFGQKGFYNMQELGLGKSLAQYAEQVHVYKVTGIDQEYKKEVYHYENGHSLVLEIIPVRALGSNGLLSTKYLDEELDVLVYFADTQLWAPHILRWAKQKSILTIPYIGVTKSHSISRAKRLIMDFLFSVNLQEYSKCHCLAKTPQVKDALSDTGITEISVAPVGLDLSLMKADYQDTDVLELKQKYGYCDTDRVLLFIGRITEEKQPLHMIDLFDRLHCQSSDYKLLMVGTGELRSAVDNTIADRGLSDSVQMIDRIPNKDIWELYRIADSFVNLNRQEIFGMAILEAMYYGCKVVAWEAPGPSFIIENGVSGCLADSDEGILKAIAEDTILPEAAHRRIVDHFTWDRTAEKLLSIAESR